MSRHFGVLRRVTKQLPGQLEAAKKDSGYGVHREGDMVMLMRAELECGHVIKRRRPIFGRARCYECKP